jgi:hypothetical protein
MRKRSSHLTRQLIEGMSSYSPYKSAKLNYAREYDPSPTINVDAITRLDIMRAIKILWDNKELSEQEVKMICYVMLDGRLSRRDISAMIKESDGVYVDQRTISRRLESAYSKISKFLGFEYKDERLFQMVAKRMGKPYPYILSDDEIVEVQQRWERV